MRDEHIPLGRNQFRTVAQAHLSVEITLENPSYRASAIQPSESLFFFKEQTTTIIHGTGELGEGGDSSSSRGNGAWRQWRRHWVGGL